MDASKSRRVLRLTLISCLVAVAVLALAAWMLASQPSRFVRRLPDGSTLRLTSVTYDGVRRRSLGNAWEQLQEWAVPKAVTSAVGGLFGFNPVGRKSIVLSGVHTGSPASSRSTDLKIVFVDAQGYEHGTNWWGQDQNGKGSASMSYRFNLPGRSPATTILWELHQFPRRGPTLRTRFYQQLPPNHWTPAAEFLLPNPAAEAFPRWAPERLPVTKRDRDLAVTLKRAMTGVTEKSGTRRAQPGEASWTTVVLSEKPDRQDDLWNPEKIRFSDPTGNIWEPDGQTFDYLPSGDLAWRFECGLWPEEPVYHFHIEYRRTEGKTRYDGKPRVFDFNIHVEPFVGPPGPRR